MRIDLDTCRDLELLAGEVRRLRAVIASEQTLTDLERGAVESALDFCERTDRPLPTSDQIATLRGLLERTNPRLAAAQKLTELDEELGLPRTPTPHSNQREVSVRPTIDSELVQ